MTISSIPTDMIKGQPLESTRPTDASAVLSNQLSFADFKAFFPTATKATGDPTTLDFGNDDPYKTNMPKASANQSGDTKAQTSTAQDSAASKEDLTNLNNDITKDTKSLASAEKTLQSLSKEKDMDSPDSNYQKALTTLDSDEKNLHTDTLDFVKASESQSNYKDFSTTMDTHHAALDQIASGLDKMGLQKEASETTAYYPLDHYQHQFPKTGTGTGPGTPTGPDTGPFKLDNGQTWSNLTDDSFHDNTKDKGQDGIGGSGNNPGIELSTSGGTLDYTSTGGPGADTLISQTKDYNNSKDNTFVLNYTLEPGAGDSQNLACSEHDLVIQGANGYQAQAGSQFNFLNDKTPAPPGYVWFQTNNHGDNETWENAALVPIPKAGEPYNVSMEVKILPDNKYEYTGLDINGKSYALNPNETTFDMAKSDWTTDSVTAQFQQDKGKYNTPVTQYYSNVSVEAGYTPDTPSQSAA